MHKEEADKEVDTALDDRDIVKLKKMLENWNEEDQKTLKEVAESFRFSKGLGRFAWKAAVFIGALITGTLALWEKLAPLFRAK